MPLCYYASPQAEHICMQVPAASKALQVQPCALGRITDQPDMCQLCGNSTFSLNPVNESCDPCPSGAQCFGSDAFIPPEQHWHSSPNSTTIVSCPNPGACGGNRTHLLDCKKVSPDYTPHTLCLPFSHKQTYCGLCTAASLVALHGHMQCDAAHPHVTHMSPTCAPGTAPQALCTAVMLRQRHSMMPLVLACTGFRHTVWLLPSLRLAQQA